MLDKEVSKVFESIANQWDRNTVQIAIKETLLTKRKRVSNETEYFDSLCENVIYLIESSHVIKAVLGQCFRSKTFPEASHVESAIVNAQNNIKKDMNNLIVKYKDKFKRNTLYESIQYAEYSYSHSKLKYDMEVDFLFAFLHPNNRSTMKTFLNNDSMEFLTTLDQVSDTYSQLFVQNIVDFIGLNIAASASNNETAATREKKKKGIFSRLFGKK